MLATPGVSSAAVNLATSRVTVKGTASSEAVALRVEEASYGLNQFEPETPRWRIWHLRAVG